ncbi:MAG TPA: PA2169 family four-helix-bundle protein [Bacteroidia bacterium]|jgi:uncharacterized protein (TIGR02284 family)|nr:PA2169 family four-helix-bundle protein [Bacteroidia bacterium]
MKAIVNKSAKQLKELILINNTRFEGYRFAAHEIQDNNLKVIFYNYSFQSKQFRNELLRLLPREGNTEKQGGSNGYRKLHKGFIKATSFLQSHDIKEVLSSCEVGEIETKKTYNDVLHHPNGLRKEILPVIRKQWIELQKAHFKIRIMQYKALFM